MNLNSYSLSIYVFECVHALESKFESGASSHIKREFEYSYENESESSLETMQNLFIDLLLISLLVLYPMMILHFNLEKDLTLCLYININLFICGNLDLNTPVITKAV